jgi:F-type H+-transporting ATPase subunit a
MFAILLLMGALLSSIQIEQAAAQAMQAQPAVEVLETVDEEYPVAEGDDLISHVLDKRSLEVPFVGYVYLPPARSWMVGPVDMTPTKYVVYLWLTGVLVLGLMLPVGVSARRRRDQPESHGGGYTSAVEALVLFFRDKVAMPNIGHGGEGFVPFVTTLFFFILVSNLFGLIPFGASATASISVTATLALMALVAIEYSGIRTLGSHYWGTIFYWNKDLPFPLRILLFLILSPVELLGKLAKPFALAIRLMANMVAGKIVIYSLLGLIFVFGSYWIAVGPVVMTVALMFLKIFVAFLQAYIFALLTSVFIGMIRHAH